MGTAMANSFGNELTHGVYNLEKEFRQVVGEQTKNPTSSSHLHSYSV